ncbi:hypothetical protein ABZ916_37100 [Streptomyces sp. NPDC046853]|uniref:hypothetical protein n=1 Tax=Streptomyces sp. NPDC046853 TaxID=3154920 RepID=UPI0033E28301
MAGQGEIMPDDPEDPMRTAMRQMMGAFAQLDRGMPVANSRRGLRIKGEKGEYAYGAPPYVPEPDQMVLLTRCEGHHDRSPP